MCCEEEFTSQLNDSPVAESDIWKVPQPWSPLMLMLILSSEISKTMSAVIGDRLLFGTVALE